VLRAQVRELLAKVGVREDLVVREIVVLARVADPLELEPERRGRRLGLAVCRVGLAAGAIAARELQQGAEALEKRRPPARLQHHLPLVNEKRRFREHVRVDVIVRNRRENLTPRRCEHRLERRARQRAAASHVPDARRETDLEVLLGAFEAAPTI
jgi:hypothetical protein